MSKCKNGMPSKDKRDSLSPPLGEEKATSTKRKGPLRGWLALLAPQKQARPGKASEGWASHQTRGSFERCLGCVVVLSAAALTQR